MDTQITIVALLRIFEPRYFRIAPVTPELPGANDQSLGRILAPAWLGDITEDSPCCADGWISDAGLPH
jgi:hypothetical protein